jgi:hypothetical protein
MSEDHFVIFLTVAVLALFTIYQSIDHHFSIKRERKINRELLDRIMARDYPSYAAGVAAVMRAENEKPSLFGLKKKPDDPETMDMDDGLGMPVT